jgi:hypothetical protein
MYRIVCADLMTQCLSSHPAGFAEVNLGVRNVPETYPYRNKLLKTSRNQPTTDAALQ